MNRDYEKWLRRQPVSTAVELHKHEQRIVSGEVKGVFIDAKELDALRSLVKDQQAEIELLRDKYERCMHYPICQDRPTEGGNGFCLHCGWTQHPYDCERCKQNTDAIRAVYPNYRSAHGCTLPHHPKDCPCGS